MTILYQIDLISEDDPEGGQSGQHTNKISFISFKSRIVKIFKEIVQTTCKITGQITIKTNRLAGSKLNIKIE